MYFMVRHILYQVGRRSKPQFGKCQHSCRCRISGYNKFSDEGGKAIKGNLIYYIETGGAADTRADWFGPNTASGLTQARLSRINQSIQSFFFCVLGAQVNFCSSILGEGGKVKEGQKKFLVLIEDLIRQPDLAKSVQRYQLAVDESKVRLWSAWPRG